LMKRNKTVKCNFFNILVIYCRFCYSGLGSWSVTNMVHTVLLTDTELRIIITGAILKCSFNVEAGAGVVSVSWYPPGLADEHGPQSDNLIPALLRLAAEYHLRICLHIEPYENRTVENLREHLAYVNRVYGSHPAYYRMRRGGQAVELPVFYVYDSYRTSPQHWARLFSSKGRAII
jgi:hypothetical protein